MTPCSKADDESQSSQSTQEDGNKSPHKGNQHCHYHISAAKLSPDLDLVISLAGDITDESFADKRWKIVGDNLDLTIKVRDMRLDNPNQSCHFSIR